MADSFTYYAESIIFSIIFFIWFALHEKVQNEKASVQFDQSLYF